MTSIDKNWFKTNKILKKKAERKRKQIKFIKKSGEMVSLGAHEAIACAPEYGT